MQIPSQSAGGANAASGQNQRRRLLVHHNRSDQTGTPKSRFAKIEIRCICDDAVRPGAVACGIGALNGALNDAPLGDLAQERQSGLIKQRQRSPICRPPYL